jgi:iron(II)-dependent oxidoreductase
MRPASVEAPPVYDENDPTSLARRMLDHGRYALLLRPQIAANLKKEMSQAAIRALDDAMGIVPEGDVLLQSWRHANDRDEADAHRERLVHVDALYLDRYPVTNRQFQQFVDDGGYEHMPLWEPTIWPAVLDFVDQTGHPGPRHWRKGHCLEGLDDHPVVGVSWYEGTAYARWAGKRLPSDPEWVKAGCWPVFTQGTRPIQRRYPWGDTMDRELANLWGSGPGATLSVFDFPDGVSVGGIYHLIGNVWEWTTSNFGVWDASARRLETTTPMKSIRGGAFDTYFETQATCQFQSGESPISRKHNIGFRCALALCDVISADLDGGQVAGNEALVACGAEAGEELV